MTESKARNWSTKTLARELLRFLKANNYLGDESTIGDLVEALKNQIVEDEVGEDFTWGE